MARKDLGAVGAVAMQLQNGYAQAIDMRDWDMFRTFFTPDVVAEYPGSRSDGMDAWLDYFIPLHDTYSWSLHMVLSNIVGEDAHGLWAQAYGFTRWILKAQAGIVQNAQVLFRDRLAEHDGSWLISHRRLDVLTLHPTPMQENESFPASVLDVVTNSSLIG